MKSKKWFSFSFFKNTIVYQRNLNFKICVKSSLVFTPFPDIILRIPVFLSKISPKSDFIRNHSYFFYFLTWISLIFLEILVGIHESFGRKIWNFGGTHEVRKKKIETHLAPRLGPRASAPAFASRSQWNPGQKIKKICAVYVEIPFWWIFCQKYSG